MRVDYILLLCAAILPACFCSAQGFTRITDEAGAIYSHSSAIFGSGLSLADFNGDGFDDISFVGNNQEPAFFVNQQDGSFEATDLGIAGTGGDMKAVIWVDIDNDSDRDLFLTSNFAGVKLYENSGDLTFTDITSSAGFENLNTRYFGASFGDYDRDGWLDLYLCNYHNPDINEGVEYENHMFQNNGDGTFTDVTSSSGASDGVKASFQSLWLDYDQDGDQDLFVINDRITQSNSLYENQGDGTFVDVTEDRGWLNFSDSMSLAAGDYDNDEDIDLFLADTFDYHNDLMKFDASTLLFENIAESAGLVWDTISWGSLWIDYDCDMIQELYVSGEGNLSSAEILNNFYANNGDDTFTSIRDEVGLGDLVTATYAAAMGDLNNDGYPDFVQNNVNPSICELLQNDGGDNNYLKVKVSGTVSNRDGIGTWIRCYAGGVVQTRHTFCGENYLSQDSDYEFFGLGQEESIDSLVVTWLSGHRDVFYDVAANQQLSLEEGESLTPILLADAEGFCEGDSLELSAGNWHAYEWTTGAETPTITVDSAGTYWVRVYTETGVSAWSDTLSISMWTPPLPSPIISDVPCLGDSTGSIDLGLNPDEIESVLWDHGESGIQLDSLLAGFYTFSLTDTSGCALGDSIEVSLLNSFNTQAIQTEDALCFGDSSGMILIELMDWQGNLELQTLQDFLLAWNTDSTQLEIAGLPAGMYAFEIQDEGGCISNFSFEIEQPDELTGTLDIDGIDQSGMASILATVTGGTPPYDLLWSTGEEGVFEIETAEEGEYTLLVTDSMGCSLLLEFLVSAIPDFEWSGVSFIPNPCGDFIEFTTSHPIDEIQIFDMNGVLLMRTQSMRQLDRLDLQGLAEGIYVLVISSGGEWTRHRLLKSSF